MRLDKSDSLYRFVEPTVAGPARIAPPEVNPQLRALEPSNSLLVDRLTQPGCGPFDPEGSVEVREQQARVVGSFEVGVGFLGDGAILMSDDTFSRLFGGYDLGHVHLGLVRLREGADPRQAAKRLQEILPVDTRAITRAELGELLERHWVDNTAVGNIFGMGAVAGFFVGVVVLFQILSADIRTQLPLYATLKAMGYRDRRLYHFVLQQSWIFALLGFVPAWVLTLTGFPLIRNATQLPVFVTPGLALSVLLMSVAMCTLAGAMSLRRISSVDPAELF